MPVGKSFFDQYSVFCVFGSVVGCVIVPLLAQSFESVIILLIVIVITSKRYFLPSAAVTRPKDNERRRQREAAQPNQNKVRKRPKHPQPQTELTPEQRRRREEGQLRAEEAKRHEEEKREEDRREKRLKKKQDRKERKEQEKQHATKETKFYRSSLPSPDIAASTPHVSESYRKPPPAPHAYQPPSSSSASYNKSDSNTSRSSASQEQKHRSWAAKSSSFSSSASSSSSSQSSAGQSHSTAHSQSSSYSHSAATPSSAQPVLAPGTAATTASTTSSTASFPSLSIASSSTASSSSSSNTQLYAAATTTTTSATTASRGPVTQGDNAGRSTKVWAEVAPSMRQNSEHQSWNTMHEQLGKSAAWSVPRQPHAAVSGTSAADECTSAASSASMSLCSTGPAVSASSSLTSISSHGSHPSVRDVIENALQAIGVLPESDDASSPQSEQPAMSNPEAESMSAPPPHVSQHVDMSQVLVESMSFPPPSIPVMTSGAPRGDDRQALPVLPIDSTAPVSDITTSPVGQVTSGWGPGPLPMPWQSRADPQAAFQQQQQQLLLQQMPPHPIVTPRQQPTNSGMHSMVPRQPQHQHQLQQQQQHRHQYQHQHHQHMPVRPLHTAPQRVPSSRPSAVVPPVATVNPLPQGAPSHQHRMPAAFPPHPEKPRMARGMHRARNVSPNRTAAMPLQQQQQPHMPVPRPPGLASHVPPHSQRLYSLFGGNSDYDNDVFTAFQPAVGDADTLGNSAANSRMHFPNKW